MLSLPSNESSPDKANLTTGDDKRFVEAAMVVYTTTEKEMFALLRKGPANGKRTTAAGSSFS
jgi:hypothetical protein